MPRYLDTRGNSTIAIAICARCSVKYPWTSLKPDPNSPGLMCCPDGCRDQLDPWRLPPRPADRISLEWARPDVPLSPGPQAVPVLPLQAAIGVNPGIIEAVANGGLQVGTDEALDVGGGNALQVGGTSDDLVPSPGLSLIEALGQLSPTGLSAAPPVSTLYQPVTWTASTYYRLGQQIVPTDPEGMAAAGNQFFVYTIIVPGRSGASPPAAWPTSEGVMVQTGDAWALNSGIWMP